jgi:hypothetical protein
MQLESGVGVGRGVYELKVTGSEWFDAQGVRWGGAIDLTMPLLQLHYVGAMK